MPTHTARLAPLGAGAGPPGTAGPPARPAAAASATGSICRRRPRARSPQSSPGNGAAGWVPSSRISPATVRIVGVSLSKQPCCFAVQFGLGGLPAAGDSSRRPPPPVKKARSAASSCSVSIQAENRRLALRLERPRDQVEQRLAVDRDARRLDQIVLALGFLGHRAHQHPLDRRRRRQRQQVRGEEVVAHRRRQHRQRLDRQTLADQQRQQVGVEDGAGAVPDGVQRDVLAARLRRHQPRQRVGEEERAAGLALVGVGARRQQRAVLHVAPGPGGRPAGDRLERPVLHVACGRGSRDAA